jgi:two-component system, NarL family, response regulator NreC
MQKIRIVVAEDHETVRQGLRALLGTKDDIEVVADAPNGREAVDLVRELKPRIAVLDLSMPEMNGLSATRAIKETMPDVEVIALTRHADDAYVQELLSAGASGYVLKQSPVEELLNAIRAVAKGERYLDTSLVTRHTKAYLSRYATPRSKPPITDRETSVLRLMAIGHSNKEIATALDIAVKTVEVHKANAMRKLDLRGRIDVVRYAVLNGWLQDP